ncbi:MAG TPA: 6-phosphogluconolactonase, partial [Blastocatellia bacterium]|nr:6-phosphogluconolactonase [Blastocatellia bacterium]
RLEQRGKPMSTKMLSLSDAQVRVYKDPAELALKAARHFARLADQYVVGSGRFTVALSGGSTPKAMFSILAASPFLETVPWSSIYFFWGDERCVPPDHQDSNYRMANETLLSKVPVPQENVFRIPAELEDHDRAAQEYALTLTQFFMRGPGATNTGTAPLANVPRFDLVFLGMGPDGHTASLFPGTTALHATDQIVVANFVEKFNAYRITLTAATINNARNVTFVAAGADKAQTLKEVLEGPYQPDVYPSQLIRPRNGSLLWMVDEAAARLLSERH